MTILAFILTICIVWSVMVLLILPRRSDEERAAEDAEFVANYCRRRGDRA